MTEGQELTLRKSNPDNRALRVQCFVYARHGRDYIGCKSRVPESDACERVRKYQRVFAVDRILTCVARLRTETCFKAGAVRHSSRHDRRRV